MEDVSIFYAVNWYILWPFGIFFPVAPRKIWQPCVWTAVDEM
jgi:hypothetical protein